MGKTFSIRLSGPAKVGGQRRGPGDVVEVDQGGLDHLVAADVVDAAAADTLSDPVVATVIHDNGAHRVFSRSEWKEAVRVATEGARNELKGQIAHLDGVIAGLNEQLRLTSENEAKAGARAESAEKAYADLVARTQADVSRIMQRNAELEATISALTPPSNAPPATETDGTDLAQPQSGTVPATQNTPPSEQAAKTAPKKGAAATTKG